MDLVYDRSRLFLPFSNLLLDPGVGREVLVLIYIEHRQSMRQTGKGEEMHTAHVFDPPALQQPPSNLAMAEEAKKPRESIESEICMF